MLNSYRFDVGQFLIKFATVRLTGSDVHAFLQSQCTYNFEDLLNKEFHLASFLSPQGQVEFYAWAAKSDDTIFLLVPIQLKKTAIQRLERYLISEDVIIEDLGEMEWNFVIGPNSKKYISENCFSGILFEEEALLYSGLEKKEISSLKNEEIDLWRCLNGWPDFYGSNFKPELLNNLRLYDLALSKDKGCYTGQETVSKIATRRGAAYSPVLLETTRPVLPGPVYSLERKAGEIQQVNQWLDRYYLGCSLLRDFRVEGMKIFLNKDEQEFEGIVRYYPLLSSSPEVKAQELFYEASEAFKKDDLKTAEDYFKKAIKLAPAFADAYESLGVMLGRLERYQEAIMLMDQLSALDPSSVLAHTNKSLFLMKLGKIEEAEQEKSLATVKSFQKFGDEAKLKAQLESEQLAMKTEWEKRENMFRQVLEIDDEDTLANYGLGSIAVERKNWEDAKSFLEKVIKADPNYSVAYLSLGYAYKGLGLKEKALNTWKQGISIAAKKGDLMPANQMQTELQNL